MQVHEIIQQAVWKQHAEEKTHDVGFSPKLGVLNEDREDDGGSNQETVGWNSVEIEKRLAANKKMGILYQVLTISSSIAVSNSRQIDVSIDISPHQFKKISVATAATFIAWCASGTGSISVASNWLKHEVDDVEETIEEGTSYYWPEVVL